MLASGQGGQFLRDPGLRRVADLKLATVQGSDRSGPLPQFLPPWKARRAVFWPEHARHRQRVTLRSVQAFAHARTPPDPVHSVKLSAPSR